jgi:1-acyl-sn-glycerol-3-phosphate acyltransferase
MSIAQKLSQLLLNISGWKAYSNVNPIPDKCVFCVAPHTSNWDFWIGKIGYTALYNVRPNFLIKQEWFKFPFNLFFNHVGGIPVNRSGAHSMTDAIIEKMKTLDRFQLAITPEGTRKFNPKWKRGFYHIAKEANVPLLIVSIDYQKKEVCIDHEFKPTDNAEADMKAIQSWYLDNHIMGQHPEKFGTIFSK